MDYRPLRIQENLASDQSAYQWMLGQPISLVCLLLPKIGAGRPTCMMANLQPRACRMESEGYMMRGSDE